MMKKKEEEEEEEIHIHKKWFYNFITIYETLVTMWILVRVVDVLKSLGLHITNVHVLAAEERILNEV